MSGHGKVWQKIALAVDQFAVRLFEKKMHIGRRVGFQSQRQSMMDLFGKEQQVAIKEIAKGRLGALMEKYSRRGRW